ncbi:MAG: DUF2075 domain-containing protein [Acidaminococcaceae bacterium]|nr:DUF2075 domain-containing protein [Anaerolineaceae bacterium]MBQ6743470.1 DUF2075 domain-containing protein [Acidaminococcaceae bacterium]MBQ6779357.1 DUF2075 domain-containing protein [Acidaminococcaceae bacterium]MBQ9573629.1 DUF2075 domain-containing protein [Acidaminococcaceae bacterium]
MIVYSGTKSQFNNDVNLNLISDKILEKLREKHLSGGQESEYQSWQNSLHFMRSAIDDPDIPNDVEVAIEYQIPRTSKRVDFMIAGADAANTNNVVVVELKQWSKAEKVDDIMRHSVRAYTGGANRIVNHPSYQAYAYATFIKNSSEQVQDERIGIKPCAYLHNCSPAARTPLDDDIYTPWLEEAPLFDKSQTIQLRNFIKKFIVSKSSSGDLLYKIDNGRIRPSKALQDCLVSLMKGNEEFMLLDDQAVVFDLCKKYMAQCRKDMQKRTIIIQGGPGTGKSVLAVNLLKEFLLKNNNACYCTKNSAPREAYQKLLAKSNYKAMVNIKQLFRSPFGLCNLTSNFYDCLIVDETHRLVKKMYGDWKGENQVKECINASLFTVFLLDEDQQITKKDIGSVEEIKKWATELGSEVIMNEDTVLQSQFRCNGSDQYIQLINNILQIGKPMDIDLKELNFDIRVFDDPNELRDTLRELNKINNKARMVAGYCYDWNVKHNRGEYDIYLENGFKAKWNLENDKIWAINPNSFEEVGCIHTAQGLEFDYIGVLIGNDLRFDKTGGKIITDRTKISKDDKSSGIRSAKDDVAERLIKNTYKTLLTRGQKGCFIYCEDKALVDYIRSFLVSYDVTEPVSKVAERDRENLFF